MALVTLQSLEGLERGHVFQDLTPPITIGREEENNVRLNDERISRFHAKIQEDQGRLIFTDLGSTNGSRVNGNPAQLHILKIGDQISVGRCVLVLGNDEELAEHGMDNSPTAVKLSDSGNVLDEPTGSGSDDASSAEGENAISAVSDQLMEILAVPEEMTLLQKTQFSDYLAHIHQILGQLVINSQEFAQRPSTDENESSENGDQTSFMAMAQPQWRQLIQLELQLARQLKNLADPEQ